MEKENKKKQNKFAKTYFATDKKTTEMELDDVVVLSISCDVLKTPKGWLYVFYSKTGWNPEKNMYENVFISQTVHVDE